MSRSVGLLIDSPHQLEDVARQVAAATEATAAATPDPGVWQLTFSAEQGKRVYATLTPNHPGVAGDALARRYRFALAARMADGASQGSSVEVRTLRDASKVLREVVDLPSLLVLDHQNYRPEPARYDEGEPPAPPAAGEVGV